MNRKVKTTLAGLSIFLIALLFSSTTALGETIITETTVQPSETVTKETTITRTTVPSTPVTVKRETTLIRRSPRVIEFTPPAPRKQTYVYYPDRGIYYNPRTRMWFWEENGAWRSGRRLPSQFLPLPPKVRIRVASDHPYEFHDRFVSKQYVKPGTTRIIEIQPANIETKIIETKVVDAPATVYRYSFYPDAGVYFNESTNEYIWKENGVWRTSRYLPKSIVIRPDLRETVVTTHDIRVTTIP